MQLYLWLKNLLESEEGQDLIEYALLVVFIALAVVALLPSVRTALQAVFNSVITGLNGAVGT
jgi:Flp pilus assembly pilin Flp